MISARDVPDCFAAERIVLADQQATEAVVARRSLVRDRAAPRKDIATSLADDCHERNAGGIPFDRATVWIFGADICAACGV